MEPIGPRRCGRIGRRRIRPRRGIKDERTHQAVFCRCRKRVTEHLLGLEPVEGAGGQTLAGFGFWHRATKQSARQQGDLPCRSVCFGVRACGCRRPNAVALAVDFSGKRYLLVRNSFGLGARAFASLSNV